jgi:hypothetical protein
MYATTPAAQASTLKSYGRRLAISGDKYAYVPHRSVRYPSGPVVLIRAASPKVAQLRSAAPVRFEEVQKVRGFHVAVHDAVRVARR